MKDSQNPLSALISFKQFCSFKEKMFNNRGSHFLPMIPIECDFTWYFRIVLKMQIIFMFPFARGKDSQSEVTLYLLKIDSIKLNSIRGFT